MTRGPGSSASVAGVSAQPAVPDDVDAICAALPETELGTSWGDRPTWKVRGKGFLLYRAPHRSAVDADGEMYDDLLVVHVADLGVKQALVEGEGPFFTVDHFEGHSAVLVSQARLGEVTRDELVELITDAWATKAPKTLVREHLDHG